MPPRLRRDANGKLIPPTPRQLTAMQADLVVTIIFLVAIIIGICVVAFGGRP